MTCTKRGFFAIGIDNGKTKANIGTLWRSAHAFDAAFIFTLNSRYKFQATDTSHASKSIPLFNFASIEDLKAHIDSKISIIGIELHDNAHDINNFVHPERAVYILGAEDSGLSQDTISQCDMLIKIPCTPCLNVSTAGSIVLYDRFLKAHKNV